MKDKSVKKYSFLSIFLNIFWLLLDCWGENPRNINYSWVWSSGSSNSFTVPQTSAPRWMRRRLWPMSYFFCLHLGGPSCSLRLPVLALIYLQIHPRLWNWITMLVTVALKWLKPWCSPASVPVGQAHGLGWCQWLCSCAGVSIPDSWGLFVNSWILDRLNSITFFCKSSVNEDIWNFLKKITIFSELLNLNFPHWVLFMKVTGLFQKIFFDRLAE